MKQTFLVLMTVFSIIGCSKKDVTSDLGEEDDVLNLSEIEQRLVGTWYYSDDYTGSNYTYNQDRTAVYANEYHGEMDEYEGFWEITGDGVLIEFYPASNESIEDWQKSPHFKRKIEFLDSDYTLKTTDFDDKSSVMTFYREGLKDGQKVTGQSYFLEFKTGELEDYVSVYATANLYNSDGTKTTIAEDVNRETKTLIIEVPEDIFRFELEFYIEDSSTVQMKFYGMNDGKVIHEETINQQEFNYKYIF